MMWSDMPNNSDCPFCNLDKARVIIANDHAIAFHDGFPVTPGHSLIVPKRHITSFFEATREEQAALFDLLAEMRQLLLNPPSPFKPVAWVPFDKGGSVSVPDGFNIGINDGSAAGQTVMHLHIHLIPRYSGDSDDPRGGVRWIMPRTAPYWKKR
jgi:diadenosine tetraphosphate (Ap4A) HIT family hydrolase